MAYAFVFSNSSWAFLSFEADTIFIVLVMVWVLLTLLIFRLISLRVAIVCP